MRNEIPEELIIRALRKQASEAEQQALKRWLSEDPAHPIVFDEFVAAWKTEFPEQPFDASHALARLNQRINQHEQQRRSSIGFRWRIAASIALVITVSTIALVWMWKSESPAPVALREVSTQPGEKHLLRLTDGTVVRLNSKSTLRFPESFDGLAAREVVLEGEAYFQVAKDAKHPFVIRSSGVETQVLGTAFNLRSTSETVTVTVAEGKVAVTAGNKRFELQPFDKIIYYTSNSTWQSGKTDLERELAWQKNTLIFENQSLSEVVDALANWYGVSISMQNEAIGRCRITGKFTNEPLENVLKAISYSLDIQYIIKNKEVTIIGKGC